MPIDKEQELKERLKKEAAAAANPAKWYRNADGRYFRGTPRLAAVAVTRKDLIPCEEGPPKPKKSAEVKKAETPEEMEARIREEVLASMKKDVKEPAKPAEPAKNPAEEAEKSTKPASAQK